MERPMKSFLQFEEEREFLEDAVTLHGDGCGQLLWGFE